MIWRTLNVNSAFGSGIRRTRTLNAVQRSPMQSSVRNAVLNAERTILAFGVLNAVSNSERRLERRKKVGSPVCVMALDSTVNEANDGLRVRKNTANALGNIVPGELAKL